MKIVVLDGYTENPGDLSWDEIRKYGEVTVYDRTSYTESDLIAERIGDADIAVINKTPVSRATLDRCPNLKAIAVLATGYNVVDCEAAKEKGIPVMNVPVYGTENVSQFAVSLLLEACSHIGEHSRSVHAGDWASNADWCYWNYPMIEVAGKTAGIIGLGRIGIDTAKVLNALNVHVIAYDSFRSDAGAEVAEYVELDEPSSSGGESAGGESPEGESPEGQAPEGESPEGQAPEGGSPEGQAPEGESPEGPAPEGEAPAEGESPEGESPEAQN